MVLFVQDKDGNLRQRWMYKMTLFDPQTIAGMTSQYEILLNAMTAMPDAQISALAELLAEDEKQHRVVAHKEFTEVSLQKLRTRRRTAKTASPQAGAITEV